MQQELPEADELGGSSRLQCATDRDFEQRYAHLITPVRDLTINSDFDVASCLDHYLEVVSQAPVTDTGGEASVNFTLAAFLTPSSVPVYSRKVAYFHDPVREVARNVSYHTLEGQNAQNADSEEARPTARPTRNNSGFQRLDEIELADELDCLPRPQQAPAKQAAAQDAQFLRQRRRPLSMVMLNTERKTKLHDLEDHLVGYKEDYQLYTNMHLESCQSSDRECGQSLDHTSGCTSPAGCALNVAYDCAHDSPLATPYLPDTVPFCGNSEGFEELPAKPDVGEAFPVSVPKVRQQENRRKPFIVVKRRIDPLDEVAGKCRPLCVRRNARKRPCNESTSLDGSLVPVAAIWISNSQYPHLLAKELQFQKKEMVMPGGERYLHDSIKYLKETLHENYCDSQSQEEEFEDSASDVSDDAGGSSEDLDMSPGDLLVEDGDRDVALLCCTDAGVKQAAQGPPSSVDLSGGDSYEKLYHSNQCELQKCFSEFHPHDLQKTDAERESRIKPLLDIQEKWESESGPFLTLKKNGKVSTLTRTAAEH